MHMDIAVLVAVASIFVVSAGCVVFYRRQRSANAARQRAEDALARMESQLRQAHRMEAIGRLAAGVTHDFNNILTVMLGFTELVLQDESLSASARRDIQQLHRSANSAVSLTRQLLAFSRKQRLNTATVDVNTVVTDFAGVLRRVVGEDISLRTVLAREPAHVMADRSQIEQVLMNLAANARDAMSGGGRIEIEVRVTSEHVTLSVQDNGPGIPAEHLPHVFEPFFTTKAAGCGTGLGLATVHGIVKQNGGTIEVDSTVAQGTCLRMSFPRLTPAPAAAGAHTEMAAPGCETVLVVEDDPGVQTLVRSALERHGYRVLVAEGGPTAMELISRLPPSAIDLVLSDVVLPQMSGTEVCTHVAAVQPALPIVLMSGYSAQNCRRLQNMPPDVPFIQKPFTPARLTAMIRKTLDDREAAPTVAA